MVLPQHPHMKIDSWLEMLDLTQYNGNLSFWNKIFCVPIDSYLDFECSDAPTESFKKFIGVEELMYFCEADIKQLGVRNSAHRARMVSSLVALRDKYEHGNGKQYKQPLQCRFIFFGESLSLSESIPLFVFGVFNTFRILSFGVRLLNIC